MTSFDPLFDWTAPELRLLSSYNCYANTTLGHFSMDDVIRVSLSVGELQAQAFKFSSENGFDECTYVYVCVCVKPGSQCDAGAYIALENMPKSHI